MLSIMSPSCPRLAQANALFFWGDLVASIFVTCQGRRREDLLRGVVSYAWT